MPQALVAAALAMLFLTFERHPATRFSNTSPSARKARKRSRAGLLTAAFAAPAPYAPADSDPLAELAGTPVCCGLGLRAGGVESASFLRELHRSAPAERKRAKARSVNNHGRTGIADSPKAPCFRKVLSFSSAFSALSASLKTGSRRCIMREPQQKRAARPGALSCADDVFNSRLGKRMMRGRHAAERKRPPF